MPPFYGHTHPLHPENPTKWEPLFTHFGAGFDQCRKADCTQCQSLVPPHGHLNKVAWWAAHFAAEMFPQNKQKSAWDWGYLSGLWHDLGKFSEEFQSRLRGAPLPVNHSTAGARHSAIRLPFGPSFPISSPGTMRVSPTVNASFPARALVRQSRNGSPTRRPAASLWTFCPPHR